MGVCTPHIACNPAPLCVDQIVIGTIQAVNTEVKVFFHNVATDVKFSLPASSDSDGLVSVDVSEINFSPDKTFIINIANKDTFQPYEVIIGTETASEIRTRFIDYKDEDFDCLTKSSFTLTTS